MGSILDKAHSNTRSESPAETVSTERRARTASNADNDGTPDHYANESFDTYRASQDTSRLRADSGNPYANDSFDTDPSAAAAEEGRALPVADVTAALQAEAVATPPRAPVVQPAPVAGGLQITPLVDSPTPFDRSFAHEQPSGSGSALATTADSSTQTPRALAGAGHAVDGLRPRAVVPGLRLPQAGERVAPKGASLGKE